MAAAPRIALHAAPARARVAKRSLAEIAAELADARERAAYERGLADAGASALDRAAARLDDAAEALAAARAALEAEAAGFALRFAVDIAREIVRAEVAAGRHDVERIVRETLGQSGVDRGPCVVHLAPEDHALLANVAFRSGTRLESDPAVARGDVHVTTAQGLFVRETEAILSVLLERSSEADA